MSVLLHVHCIHILWFIVNLKQNIYRTQDFVIYKEVRNIFTSKAKLLVLGFTEHLYKSILNIWQYNSTLQRMYK